MHRWKTSRVMIFVPALALFLAEICAASPLADPPQAREIKVVARKFEFQPATITVRRGEPARLMVTSEDVDHGIAIEAFGIDQQVKAKQTKVIEFTPTREGTFEFSCSVFCGDGHPRMTGQLIVTANQDSAPSGMKVSFDENEQGVVIVESNGERMRIDTRTRSVARLEATGPLPAPPPAQGQTDVAADKERGSSKTQEPYDYHVVNIPTPKRVPRHSLNVYFTHRFQQPIKPLEDSDDDLLGLDSFAVSSLGFTYGITDRLYANVYRSPICQGNLCKTIEIGLGYHLLDEAGRSPVALSAYASAEGDDNFRRRFTYNIQAMIGRSVTKYVNLFFSPAVHINANGNGRFNPRPEDFPPEAFANDFRLGTHTGSFGFGVNARVRPSASLLFEYTPRVGFKLGRVTPVFDEDAGTLTGFENDSEAAIGFGIEKRMGRHVFSLTFSNTQTTTTSRYNSSNLVLPPKKFSIGFNLFRRLL
jgi:cytochrome c oxidase subunit 2